MKKNIIKIRVFPNSGRLLSIMATSRRMLGTRLTLLKGLRTRSTLSMLNFTELSVFRKTIKNSKMLERKTMKSTMFHSSLKYAFLCLIMP